MRFEVGEMARFVVARYVRALPYVGAVVTVISTDPDDNANPYEVVDAAGEDWWCADYQLQKLNPPEEPLEMTQAEECEA